MDKFDPGDIEAFYIKSWDYDQKSRTARFCYSLDEYDFEERLEFVTSGGSPAVAEDSASFERALFHLHIAAGVSYYKAAAPKRIEVETGALSTQESEFHRLVYDNGLREFAARNSLALPLQFTINSHGPARLPSTLEAASASKVNQASYSALVVPIGGGKDSMVLAEALKPLKPRLLAVNPRPFMRELASQADLELIEIRRTLDPKLLDINGRGALNGHVPITGIISLTTIAAGYIYGYRKVAMAIERSASEETTVLDGVMVNHQFSKSRDFELALKALIREAIDPKFQYGAALRPYAELAISRAFAKMAKYHSTFRSCNRVFSSDASNNGQWCGKCPKCRFVALTIAPFMPKEAVTAIIGRDMFDDPSQVDGFASLMSADKPYECVGERRESAIALHMLAGQSQWQDSIVVRELAAAAQALATEQDAAMLWKAERLFEFADPLVASLVAATLEEGTGLQKDAGLRDDAKLPDYAEYSKDAD